MNTADPELEVGSDLYDERNFEILGAIASGDFFGTGLFSCCSDDERGVHLPCSVLENPFGVGSGSSPGLQPVNIGQSVYSSEDTLTAQQLKLPTRWKNHIENDSELSLAVVEPADQFSLSLARSWGRSKDVMTNWFVMESSGNHVTQLRVTESLEVHSIHVVSNGFGFSQTVNTLEQSHLELGAIATHFPRFVAVQTTVSLLVWLEMQFPALTADDPTQESLLVPHLRLMVQHDCIDHRLEVWRWLSYQILHETGWHLLVNIIILALAGIPLERFYGSVRMALMFNVGVLGGTLSYFVSDPHVWAIGMSGGCFALQGMHLAKLAMNWHGMEYRLEKLFFLAVLTTVHIITGLLTRNSGSSHSIHFGGYVAGLCIGMLLGRSSFSRRSALRLRAVVLLFGCLLVAWCVWWCFAAWPPSDIWERIEWCWTRQVSNTSIFGDAEYRCVRCRSQGCIAQWQAQGLLREVSPRVCHDSGWAVTER